MKSERCSRWHSQNKNSFRLSQKVKSSFQHLFFFKLKIFWWDLMPLYIQEGDTFNATLLFRPDVGSWPLTPFGGRVTKCSAGSIRRWTQLRLGLRSQMVGQEGGRANTQSERWKHVGGGRTPGRHLTRQDDTALLKYGRAGTIWFFSVYCICISRISRNNHFYSWEMSV